MKVLITGGAGFIGSHLCKSFLQKGHKVIVLDDFSTGSYTNIAPFVEDRGNFKLIVDSVLNQSIVEELVKESDVVFHLASVVGVNLVLQEPIKTIKTIVEGTSNVLLYASRYRKKVLITSSSEVYGKGVSIPFSENDDTVQGPTSSCRWAYANAKAMDEFLALAYWQEEKLPVICVRLFNVVGPRQSGMYGMVVPRFVSLALKDEPIVVYGDGYQTRSFGYVEDVVDVLSKLIDCDEALGRVINVGGAEEISINDLALRIKGLSNSKSSIEHITYEEAYGSFGSSFEDMRRRVPNLSLVKKLIDFRSFSSLDSVILSVIDYYKNLKGG